MLILQFELCRVLSGKGDTKEDKLRNPESRTLPHEWETGLQGSFTAQLSREPRHYRMEHGNDV